MKNAIMTWFHFENYGTNLQAYALQKFLRLQKTEAIVINYIQRDEKIIKRKQIKNIFNYIKRQYNKFLWKIINKIYGEEINNKKLKFQNFRQEKINFTKQFHNKEELKNLNEDFENFIVGSDQVWNPKSESSFFLDFVKEDKNKIAYAPSFGVSVLSKERMSELKPLLKRFNYLSSREYDGKNIINEIIDNEVTVVLDPTFLLTKKDWLELCNYKCKEKYILCYFLDNKNYYWKYVNKVKSETGYSIRIIPIHPKSFFKQGKLEIDIGPIEFVQLINNAEIVITDSYHGAIFSIIMEKKFTVLKRFEDIDEKSQNSRVYSLLKIVKLENHIIDKKIEKIVYNVNDYEKISEIISNEREKSIRYLINAINKK